MLILPIFNFRCHYILIFSPFFPFQTVSRNKRQLLSMQQIDNTLFRGDLCLFDHMAVSEVIITAQKKWETAAPRHMLKQSQGNTPRQFLWILFSQICSQTKSCETVFPSRFQGVSGGAATICC